VTSQKDQIQSLITDIEQVLETERPKKPWVRASDMEPQRHALAKVQEYLRSLQQSFDAPEGWGPIDPATGQIVPTTATPDEAEPVNTEGVFSGQPTAFGNAPGASPESVLQSLLTEMKFLKSSALEPLRREMDSLRLERDGLQQEVKGLEAQRSAMVASAGAAVAGRSNISEEQLNEFLSVLMERLQERLSVQVTQTLGQLETDYSESITKLTEATDTEILNLRPAGQSIEEMRELQSRSDQLLVNIESTLQGMYETLQKNIDSYQISLNEGIENMHSLGRQGEVIVRSLVDHLTQQLGQTAPPEPAFFPPRSAQSDAQYQSSGRSSGSSSGQSSRQSNTQYQSNYAYALADSPNPGILSSGASPAEALSATGSATATVEGETAVSDIDGSIDSSNANDTVSSLDEILPEGSFEAEDLEIQGPSALVDEANQMDIGAPLAAEAAVIAAPLAPLEAPDASATDLQEAQSQEAQLQDADAAGGDSNEPVPEDCIREDGTIDLDLLKLDIDRDEAEETLTADDVMVDAAAADAQVAAAEAEDPEIEAKVMPTADAAYLADLTLDDLTSVESFSNETADQDSPQADGLASVLPDLGEPSADTSDGLAARADVTETDRAQADTPETDSTEADSEESNADESGANEGGVNEASAIALGAAALGAAAAAGAEKSEASEASSDSDFWDSSSVERPDSAQVPDIPDAQNEGASEASDSTSLDIDDTVSVELAEELEADSMRADQIAASAVGRGLEAVSTLTPDLEEPIVSEEDMPEPQRLDADAAPMESSQLPDWPESEDTPENNDIPESEDTPESNDIPENNNTEESDTNEAETSEPLADGAESDPTLPLSTIPAVAASSVVAASLLQQDPPQFVDEDPFRGEDLPSVNADNAETSATEADLESEPSELAAPTDFDDDLDFFETSDVADKAADDLIERLSTESFDDDLAEDVTELADESVGIQPIEEISGLAESPSALPVIAPPLPDTPRPETAAPETTLKSAPDSSTPELSNDEPDDGDSDPTDGQPASWFLGIDLGTTGLSAVLINRLGEQVYPLYWPSEGMLEGSVENGGNQSEAEEAEYGLFRLPVVLQINDADGDRDRPISAVGPDALNGEQTLRSIKPLLKIGIPQENNGPLVQWSDRRSLPLQSIQAALTQLLSTLSPQDLGCKAIDLKPSALRRILGNLEGIAVGYPNNWPDTYSFNVREAVLAAGIAAKPEQIFFVEEAIAALLSALPDPQAELDEADDRQPSLYNCNWQGGTVIISAGATLTEAGVVNLPTELDQLIYRDFALRSFTYAGDSLDQDIVCQLLHVPAKQAASESQAASPKAPTGWDSLGLDQLQLPQTGEADRIKRHRLRQRLNDSQLGREVIAAARELKMVLQDETQCELTLAGQSWVVKRKDLETKVFIPYIQRVNRQINGLLNQKGMSAQAVNQVICTGGSAALGAIARWLRQKFPNATIIQDTYSGEYSNSCSRVAYGLANLCNYPHVLDTHRHQYNDYFLLLELLRVLPDQPLPAGGILHRLEQRGVNIQACQSHILALIEGHLPPGLVPTEGDRPLISAQSPNIETYRALSELPLFKKQGGQIYIADEAQGQRLRQHLETLLSAKQQTLNEPLTANLITESA